MTFQKDKYDRALGAVLGALVGDALGGVLEFLDHKPAAQEVEWAFGMPGGGIFELAPGQFTDDGEMTIALLNALLVEKKYREEIVAESYIQWAQSKPFDIGTATHNALVEAIPGESTSASVYEAAATYNAFSQANGCLMRISPLAITGSGYPLNSPHVWKAFERDARMTHPHENCVLAASIYGTSITNLICEGEYAFSLSSAPQEVVRYIPRNRQDTEVNEWLDEVARGKLPHAREKIGWVKIGFSLAFHHLINDSSFTAAMRQTLLLGGDTDTNACIVGAMVGARYGASAIPIEWREAVLRCDTSKGPQPRPALYSAENLEDKVKKLLHMA